MSDWEDGDAWGHAPHEDPGPLPRLVLIADGFVTGRERQSAEHVRRAAARAVGAGVRAVMLRDHDAGESEFDRSAARLRERLLDVRPDLMLIVNTRVETAARLGAALHVGARGPGVREARTACERVGVSAHTLEEVTEAEEAGAAYATLSPIFVTPTHPTATPLGPDALRAACAAVPDFPVFALGGLSPRRARACREAGAYGVAVLSGILDANRIAAATTQFLDAVHATIPRTP